MWWVWVVVPEMLSTIVISLSLLSCCSTIKQAGVDVDLHILSSKSKAQQPQNHSRCDAGSEDHGGKPKKKSHVPVKKAAAAMAVGIGSLSDPTELPVCCLFDHTCVDTSVRQRAPYHCAVFTLGPRSVCQAMQGWTELLAPDLLLLLFLALIIYAAHK